MKILPPGLTIHNLVAEWAFNPSDNLTDSTYNKILLTNSSATIGTENIHDSCYSTFNATTSLESAGSPAVLDDIIPLSIDAWIKASGEGENANGRIVAKEDSAALGTGGWAFNMTTTMALIFQRNTSSSNVVRTTNNNAVLADQWTHVGLTYDGSGLYSGIVIYVNGVAATYKTETDASTYLSDAAFNLTIGNRTGTDRTFNGSIGPVRIWNKILTPEQMGWLYDSSKSENIDNHPDPYSSIQTIVTEASTTPSATKMTLNSNQNAIQIWSGEQAVAEESFYIYVAVNGGAVKKIRAYRWQGIIVNATYKATIAIGTSDGRTLKAAAMRAPSTLETISGVTGTAFADEGVAGFWTPTSPHVLLLSENSNFKISSNGAERTVFMSEYDGSAWSPVTFVVVPASTDIKVRCTYKKIALATLDASTVGITAPTGATIGGSSSSMTLGISKTGATYNVTANDEADLRAKLALAVAGDEVVIPSGTYTMTANITQASFTANVSAGNVGGEGVIIRSATGVAADVTIAPNNSTTGFSFVQSNATLYTYLKGITVDVTGVAAGAFFQGGKWKVEDCRFTGISTTVTAPACAMDSSVSVIDFQALRVQVDNCVEDGFDGNGNGSDSAGRGSTIKLYKCTGFASGTTNDNQQVVTTHNGQRLEVYGGNFYDARAAVFANDSNAASVSHLFFTTISDGASGRHGAASDITGFFVNSDSSLADSFLPDPGGYLIGCNVTRDGYTSGITAIRFAAATDAPANIPIVANRITINTGRCIFPSVGGGTYMFNILQSTSGEAIRLNNYVATGSTANSNFYNNTLKGSAIALSYGDVNLPSVLRNNACTTNTNSIAGVTAPIDATIDGNYNVLDPAVDVDYTPGANDTTGVDAALDSNDFPTDAGNCDSNGDSSLYDWVGGIDIWGFPAIYKVGVLSKGARQIAEIVSGADLFPKYWI